MSDFSLLYDTVIGYAGMSSVSLFMSTLTCVLFLILYRKVDKLHERSHD